MTDSNVSVFDTTVQKTQIWLKDMQDAFGWAQNEHEAYIALRAGLHFVRDRLPTDEVADLSAQLPMLVRGFFFEGWHPANKPLQINNDDEMTAYIQSAMSDTRPVNPLELMEAVFQVLNKNLTPGEMDHIRTMLPDDLVRHVPEA